MYVRGDVNSWGRVTHENYENWSPINNADSKLCFLLLFSFFIILALTLTLNREVFSCNIPSYDMQIFVIARYCFDA